jgi:glutamate-5-semialdehyde dehydrogenase
LEGVLLDRANEAILQSLVEASRWLSRASSEMKNNLLNDLAKELMAQSANLVEINKNDLIQLGSGRPAAFRDRLTLTSDRIAGMVTSLKQVAALADPVGEVLESKTLQNGLILRRVRSPLGIVLFIFESRPNVILESFSLAFKSGNAIFLRGGSEAKFTAAAIYKMITQVFKRAGIVNPPFYGLEDYDRSLVEELLKRNDCFDVVVPRGGDKLIHFVQQVATMPIIKNDRGMCHIFVDEEADLEMAVRIVINAKCQRPGVCNSTETVLVHEKIASQFLIMLQGAADSSLQWRVDAKAFAILKSTPQIKLAAERDWDTEHLDLILNCRLVEGLSEALIHIGRHGSKHSEAIVTSNELNAREFQQAVDAAVVYWNASTRFTDGFEFGLGGELGISTQKLHVRGPVGLRELTSARWIVDGSGQIRS